MWNINLKIGCCFNVLFIPDVANEKTQQNLFAGIASFDSSKLKHAETQEKNPLPDKQCKFCNMVI